MRGVTCRTNCRGSTSAINGHQLTGECKTIHELMRTIFKIIFFLFVFVLFMRVDVIAPNKKIVATCKMVMYII